MDLPAAHMFQRAAVDLGANHLLHLFAGIQFDFFIRGSGFKLLLPLAQRFELPLVIGEIAVAGDEIGVDMVFADAFANDARAEVGDFKQRLQPLFADVLFHRFDVVTDTGHHLAAVAPGTAVAKMARLQHHHVGDTLFRQLKGGVNPREAAADNHHVGFNIFPQRREMEVVFLRRAVVVQRIDFNVHRVTLWSCLAQGPHHSTPCGR